MADTFFAEKLKDTKMGQVSRLYMTALQALRRHNNRPFAAQRTIADAIQNDLLAIKELCGDELRQLVERKAYDLARKILLDQSGDALRDEAGLTGCAKTGRAPFASASSHEPVWTKRDIVPQAKQDHEDVSLSKLADGGRLTAAQPPRETKSTNDGERGQSSSARVGPNQPCPSSPSPKAAGNGHRAFAESHGSSAVSGGARFAPGHARRGAASISAVQATMAKSLMDTFTIRGGRIIGDILLKELPGIIGANRREAAILERIKNHAANGGPSQMVREIISETSLQTYIAEAEVAHAA